MPLSFTENPNFRSSERLTAVGWSEASLRQFLGLPQFSTDNVIARFDGVIGHIQTSGVTIDDSDNITNFNSVYDSVTNPTLAAPLDSFGGVAGALTTTAIVAAQSTYNSGTPGAAGVFETVIESGVTATAAPVGVWGGIKLHAQITNIDAAGMVAQIANMSPVTDGQGTALYALARGDIQNNTSYPFAGPIGIIVNSEPTNTAGVLAAGQHPRAGIYVASTAATTTWKRGLWVSSAQDYGVLVGTDAGSPFSSNPTVAYGYMNTAGNALLFKVKGTDGTVDTTGTYSINDLKLADQSGGVNRLSGNGTNTITLPTVSGTALITQRSTFSNTTYSVLTTDFVVAQTGTMTAPRTVTLPAASSFPSGRELIIMDESQTVTSTNTISLAPTGTDLINGSNTTQVAINAAGGYVGMISDGSTKWTSERIAVGSPMDVGGILGANRGGTGVANNAASTITISGSFGTTFTVTGTTAVTLPTSGTLAALGLAQTWTANQLIQRNAGSTNVGWNAENQSSTGTAFNQFINDTGGSGAALFFPGSAFSVTAMRNVFILGTVSDFRVGLATGFALRWLVENGAAGGHFLAATDNTYDIGQAGALRPRTIYAATSVVGGTFSRVAPVTETGTTHTVAVTTTHLICNQAGTVTVTLPTASSFSGRELYIKTITANTVISASSNVVPSTSATAGTAILPATDGAWAFLVSDGTNWIIMAANPLV
jgi:hypothetical protein